MVLRNTNIILSGADPEFISENMDEAITQLLTAGKDLADLVTEIAADRAEHPQDDVITCSCQRQHRRRAAHPGRARVVLHLARRRRERDHPDGDLARAEPADRAPGPARAAAGGHRGTAPRRGRGDRQVRLAGHLDASLGHSGTARSTATTTAKATRPCCSTGRPTGTSRCSPIPAASTSPAPPTRTWASALPDRISASARTSPGARSGSCSRELLHASTADPRCRRARPAAVELHQRHQASPLRTRLGTGRAAGRCSCQHNPVTSCDRGSTACITRVPRGAQGSG